MLVGRTGECARIELLLDAARRGRGGALVLCGEAGVGKTALLRQAAQQAAGFRVLGAQGVESEMELPFAGLSDLLRPVLGELVALPSRQQAALRGALALGAEARGEPFAVCAAALSLLGVAAEKVPLAVLVDDAHWLDVGSAEALAFAARRLDAEQVAMLFAVRDGEPAAFDPRGLEVLRLAGLADDAARALLATHARHPPAPAVVERILWAARGNPLALIELVMLLSRPQLAGEEPLEEPLPVGAAVQRAFLRRVERLGEPVRRALLVAAASVTGELRPILRAAAALGLTVSMLEQAETAGLVALQAGRVVFHHPLVRSVVYVTAPPAERRAVHRALAAALQEKGDDAEQAWHLAGAAFAPDEAVATALERAARVAGDRGGQAAAASAFERAARLSEDPQARVTRLVAAAEAARLAGRLDKAASLLEEAATHTAWPGRARIWHTRGRIELFRGRAETAYELLTTAAEKTAFQDRDTAATMLAEAAVAAFLRGDTPGALATAQRADQLRAADGGLTELITTLALGVALDSMGQTSRSVPTLLRAAAIAEQLHEKPSPVPVEYVLFAALVLVWTGEFARARRLVRQVLEEARTASALGILPLGLYVLATLETRTGQWAAAYASATEAARIAADTGDQLWRCYALGAMALIEAARGQETQCRAHATEAMGLAGPLEIEDPRDVRWALGSLELGMGRPEEAIRHLEPMTPAVGQGAAQVPAIIRPAHRDLVEAYIRAGRPVPDTLLNNILAAKDIQSPVFQAGSAHCLGLLADEMEDVDRWFTAALRAHQTLGMPFLRARTQLCYGERLRRVGRRVEARIQLRPALATFEHLGAEPWADRAAAEIRASGETLRRRDPTAAEQLTPQELQIALTIAGGVTNREAGARLFLSPKTIEVHLSRIYRKLGIRSRTELAHLLVEQDVTLAAKQPG
jgi:DNA-binding CsgD family transcriptional regulator